MTKIKNHLTTTFGEDNIPRLIEYTATKYRPYDPGQYLYRLVTEFSNGTKFSDKFIELSYTTLIAWNMNQRGAKLSDFTTFKNSLLLHRQKIESLDNLRIEKLADTNSLIEKLKFLYENIQLVADGKPKLVTFSKTLHYFLPNLLMPIDRRYTLTFFYKNTTVPRKDSDQFQIYSDIFLQFKQLATIYNFDSHIDGHWNKNIPKVIDNIIIAHCKELTQPKFEKSKQNEKTLL